MYKKDLPKNLNECTIPDDVTNHLWDWATLIKTIGAIISILMAIGGLIASCPTIEEYEEVSLLSIFIILIVAVLNYLFFYVVSLLIYALANIAYNTHVTANVELYNTSQIENNGTIESQPKNNIENNKLTTNNLDKNIINDNNHEPINEENHSTVKIPPAHKWRCERCGKYITSEPCNECGYSSVKAEEWKCPKCGKNNNIYITTCGCGEEKPNE